MPFPYAAVLFDLDGTLIDTEALCNETGVAACRALGLNVELPFFETLAGIHDAERARLIAAHAGAPVDPAAFFDLWDRLTDDRIGAGLPLKPGAAALLAHLTGQGVPMAVATSSRRAPARAKIAAAGLAPHFAAVITVDDVARAKPAPDPYLAAAAALGVAAGRCLAFEDSETGAASARAAGCTVVQVPDLHASRGAHAHHLAADLLSGAAMAGVRLG